MGIITQDFQNVLNRYLLHVINFCPSSNSRNRVNRVLFHLHKNARIHVFSYKNKCHKNIRLRFDLLLRIS